MPEPKLHVMFSASAAGTLRQALLMANRPDEVLCLFDNFSFGPLATDDPDRRGHWMEEHLGYSGWDEIAGESGAFLHAFDNPEARVTAWISKDHSMIYAGFLWWLSQIGDDVPVYLVETHDLHVANAQDMSRLLGREVVLSRELRDLYRDRWRQLQIENAPFRVVGSGDLISAQIEHFDGHLIRHATSEWRKMARIVAHTMADFVDAGAYQAGDLVLGARLVSLAQAGTLEWRGDLAHMQSCELRLPPAREPSAASRGSR